MGNIQTETTHESETLQKGERDNVYNVANVTTLKIESELETATSAEKQNIEDIISQATPDLISGQAKSLSCDQSIKLASKNKTKSLTKTRRWTSNTTKPLNSTVHQIGTDSESSSEEIPENILLPIKKNDSIFVNAPVLLLRDIDHPCQKDTRVTQVLHTVQDPASQGLLNTSSRGLSDNEIMKPQLFAQNERITKASSSNLKQSGQGDTSQERACLSSVQKQKPSAEKSAKPEHPTFTLPGTSTPHRRSKRLTIPTQHIQVSKNYKHLQGKMYSVQTAMLSSQDQEPSQAKDNAVQVPIPAISSQKEQTEGNKILSENISNVHLTSKATVKTGLLKKVNQSKNSSCSADEKETGQVAELNGAEEKGHDKSKNSLHESLHSDQQNASNQKNDTNTFLAQQATEGSLGTFASFTSKFTLEERNNFLEGGLQSSINMTAPPSGPSDHQETIQLANKILSSGISYADALKQCLYQKPSQDFKVHLQLPHPQESVASGTVLSSKRFETSQAIKVPEQDNVCFSKNKQPFYGQLLTNLKGSSLQKKKNVPQCNILTEAELETLQDIPQAQERKAPTSKTKTTQQIFSQPLASSTQNNQRMNTCKNQQTPSLQSFYSTGAKPKFNWVPPTNSIETHFQFQSSLNPEKSNLSLNKEQQNSQNSTQLISWLPTSYEGKTKGQAQSLTGKWDHAEYGICKTHSTNQDIQFQYQMPVEQTENKWKLSKRWSELSPSSTQTQQTKPVVKNTSEIYPQTFGQSQQFHVPSQSRFLSEAMNTTPSVELFQVQPKLPVQTQVQQTVCNSDLELKRLPLNYPGTQSKPLLQLVNQRNTGIKFRPAELCQAESVSTQKSLSEPAVQYKTTTGVQSPVLEKYKSIIQSDMKSQRKSKPLKPVKRVNVQLCQTQQTQNSTTVQLNNESRETQKICRPSKRWQQFQVDTSCTRKCNCKHKDHTTNQLPKNVTAWLTPSRNHLAEPPWVSTVMLAASLVAGTKFCLDHYEAQTLDSD